MFKYDVKIKLKSGESVQGVALTTTYNADKKECLMLESKSENDEKVTKVELILDTFAEMDVLTEGARFQKVNFT